VIVRLLANILFFIPNKIVYGELIAYYSKNRIKKDALKKLSASLTRKL